MVGVAPKPEFREIKMGVLVKRSQNKSMVTQENYQTRLFVLDTGALRYFAGNEKERGDEKGCIELNTVLVVEPVEDGLLPNHRHVFQVVYTYELDMSPIALYVEAPNPGARDSWITAIRTEAQKNEAALLDYYHRGILVDEVYNCCGRKKEMEGCQKASQHTVGCAGTWSIIVTASTLESRRATGSIDHIRLCQNLDPMGTNGLNA
ncbi:tyrosine-protein kinase [Plakobranchus ocellatus]|uniref:Tyrosine-protein kinase n=1 Tax=Plakobranchus ocellatus TaxID=259542 RepID=A0AAV4AQ71_9GAST|nr:tyrosine-protein kinase [Plakobranchus ocellatus]